MRPKSSIVPIAMFAYLMGFIVPSTVSASDTIVEVVKIEATRSPSIHLALVNRDLVNTEKQVEYQRQAVHDAEIRVSRAKSSDKRVMQAKLAKEQRELRNLQAQFSRLKNEADGSSFRLLTIAHCWDGFAKSGFDVWLTEDNKYRSLFRPGEFLQCELIEEFLDLLRAIDADAIRYPNQACTQLCGYSVSRANRMVDAPEGFLRCKEMNSEMYWDIISSTNPSEIEVWLDESAVADETMLAIGFQSPNGKWLSSIQFKVFALDSSGTRSLDLTNGPGITEHCLKLDSNTLNTYMDPGRRFAYGFEIEIVNAEYQRANGPAPTNRPVVGKRPTPKLPPRSPTGNR